MPIPNLIISDIEIMPNLLQNQIHTGAHGDRSHAVRFTVHNFIIMAQAHADSVNHLGPEHAFRQAVDVLVREYKSFEDERAQWEFERVALLNKYILPQIYSFARERTIFIF
jgi:hypothetical protein